jgi:periplasmic divalent cation tolerance protein
MDETVILYTTWPDAETAQAVGTEVVEQALAACANIFAPMMSIYRWDGAVEQATEIPMILKTTRSQVQALRDLVLARHPYEVPCVLALPVDAAGSSPAFLAWISQSVEP